MNEHRSVVEDVQESGLIDCLQYLYGRLLEELAELADRSSGQEFSATAIQIANCLGIDRRLGEEKRTAPVETMIKEMIRVGVVELVSESDPSGYRIAARQRLKEIAEKIKVKEIVLHNVSIPFIER